VVGENCIMSYFITCTLLKVIKMIKSRRMKWAGHVGFCWESQKERGHWEDQDVSGWIILKLIVERYDKAAWTGLIWLRIGTSRGLF
jgi:hypothetical protein